MKKKSKEYVILYLRGYQLLFNKSYPNSEAGFCLGYQDGIIDICNDEPLSKKAILHFSKLN